MTPPEAGKLLGVAPPGASRCRSQSEADAVLNEWRDTVVQAAWKREVKRCHPDRSRDEADRERRTIQTKRVNRARDVLGELRFVMKAPQRHRTRVVIFTDGYASNTTSTATTTGGYPWSF